MTLTSKQKYAIAGASVLISFALGRYSTQSPEVKTKTEITQQTNTDQDKHTHTQETITTTKTPDGTVKTVQEIMQVADTETKSLTNKTTNEESDTIPPKINTLNISALIANDFSRGLLVPTYGASVTKQILGPATIGAFGLTNGVVGVSIGLNF